MVNYNNRPGLSVSIEKGTKTQSKLVITGVTSADSGTYTCSAADTAPARVDVHVSDGKKLGGEKGKGTVDFLPRTFGLDSLFCALQYGT